MKKLTKAQELAQQETTIALIAKNAPILFDIDNAVALGKQFKSELDQLTKENNAIIEIQRAKCLKDFKKLQEFLGEYKDLVVMSDEEGSMRDQHFNFVVGGSVNSDKSINFSYFYGREWWQDADSFVTINGKKHQSFYPEYIEVWSNKVGETEHYDSLEEVFNDNDYVALLEELVTEFIIKG